MGSSPPTGWSWLRSNASALRKKGTPWFMVLSFINPHDVLWADANASGEAVQKPVPPERHGGHPRRRGVPEGHGSSRSGARLTSLFQAPGCPAAHWEFFLVTDRLREDPRPAAEDMWHVYDNYYLNLLRDNDRHVASVLQALDALGPLEGHHRGLHRGPRGAGRFPRGDAQQGAGRLRAERPRPHDCRAPGGPGAGTTRESLTSHIDLLPTLAGLPRAAPARRSGR